MSQTKQTPDDGGPAFPTRRIVNLGGGASREERLGGMTLRDYFAAHLFNDARKAWEGGHPDGYYGIARHAYLMADAMLKARQP